MWGSIIGDLAGSIYEYEQFSNISIIKIDDIISENSFFSDDTILTVAVLDALLNDQNYEYYLKKYAMKYSNYTPDFKPYFKSTFSPGFTKWVKGNEIGTSKGNGAMMRISSVGYLCNSEEEVIKNARLATIPSHNSNEAIYASTVVAMIIYLARQGFDKNQIISYLNLNYSYSPFEKFNTTCSATLDNCLYALFTSNNFEEAIKKIISFGGDTDTNASIVGAMAEALFGIDNELIATAKNKIPLEFSSKIEQAYEIINNKKMFKS